MRSRIRSVFPLVILLSVILTWSTTAVAQQRMISVSEAIEQAIANNRGLALSLWEKDLQARESELDNYPTVNLDTSPVRIEDGAFKPQGTLSVGMPLTEALQLGGTFSTGADPLGSRATPSVTLTLKYKFFEKNSLPAEKTSSDNTTIIRSENELVMKTIILLIDLREKLDQFGHRQGWYEYFQRSLEAAEATPNYDDLGLKREIRNITKELANLAEVIDQLQQELRYLLGDPEDTEYSPVLHVHDFGVEPELVMLIDEAVAYDEKLEQARLGLERAQANLAAEQKSRGWHVTADGRVSWHPHQEPNTNWSIGLEASKTLCPRHLVMEKLELQVAQAELHFAETRRTVADRIAQGIKGVNVAQDSIQLFTEQLQEAQDDLELIERQFAAGFVTELEIVEARLNLRSVEIDHSHARFAYVQSVLQLYGQCGRELKGLLGKLLV